MEMKFLPTVTKTLAGLLLAVGLTSAYAQTK